jgi:hypothetical protein
VAELDLDNLLDNLSDIARELYERLTGREGAVTYEFDDLTVEVPRDFGADAPKATWKLSGKLRISGETDKKA